MEASFLVVEGGDLRLLNQPRGYYLDIVENDGRKSLFCYLVAKEDLKFIIYHKVGRSMPAYCAESDNIVEALKIAFDRVNKNARILARGTKLEYKLLRNSEFLPENLENVTLI